jgi:hypothetical protein
VVLLREFRAACLYFFVSQNWTIKSTRMGKYTRLNTSKMRKHSSLIKKQTSLDGTALHAQGLLIPCNPKSGEAKVLAQAVKFINKMMKQLFPDAKLVEFRVGALEIDLKFVRDGEDTTEEVETPKSNDAAKRTSCVSLTNTACVGVMFLRFKVRYPLINLSLRLIFAQLILYWPYSSM